MKDKTYPIFREYAGFIRENYIDEFVTTSLHRAKEVDLPLLQFFKNYTEKELFEFSKSNIIVFLNNVKANTDFEVFIKNIADWKENKIQVPKSGIDAKDMAYTPNVRKYTFLKLIPQYTADINIAVQLAIEIENYYTETNMISLEAFVEIQQEIIQRERDFLQTVIDNTEEGISAFDAEKKVTIWNRALEQRTGVKRTSILGQYVFKFFPGYEDSDQGKGVIRALNGERLDFENQPLERGGYFDATVIPLKDHTLKVIGALTISRDVTHKKLALDRIIKSETSLKEAQQMCCMGNWEFNTIENQIWWSDELFNIFGREIRKDGLVDLDYYSAAIYPPDAERIKKEVTKILNGEVSQTENEHRIILPKGEEKWIFNKIEGFKDENGKVFKIVGIAQDITERKLIEIDLLNKNQELAAALEELRSAEESLLKLNNGLEIKVDDRTKSLQASEEELRQSLEESISLNIKIAESENLLSSIINQTPISTWIADNKGTMLRLNEACLKLFGANDSAQGVGRYNLFQDPYIINSPHIEEIRKVFSEGSVCRFETEYNLSKVDHVDVPQGREIHIITTIFPVKNENNEVINVVVQAEDITEQKAAQEAIIKNEQQLRLITDSIPALVCYVDNKQIYRFNNKAYGDWFGQDQIDVSGKSIKELIGDDAYKFVSPLISRVLNGEEVYEETVLKYKHGGNRYVAINYIPHITDNKVLGFYSLISDITNRKKTEESLKNALLETSEKNTELSRKNDFLDNFVFMAAHDLKSPVINLKQLILLITESTDKAKIDSYLKLLETSVNRLDYTVNGLVEVIEVQSDHNITIKEIAFKDILNVIEEENQHKIITHKVTIEAQFEYENIVYIEAYILSILKNLISNAIKYRSEERKLIIKISTKKENGFVILIISDNGMGMDLDKFGKNLFKPFTRFTNKSYGKGIGLHLIKSMAEKNGGWISVDSEVEVGSVFRIYLKEYEHKEKNSNDD